MHESSKHILICLPWRKRHDVTVLQVPKKGSLPSDEDLSKEVVNVLSGVDVLEFNIKMLMKHLSKLVLVHALSCMIRLMDMDLYVWHCANTSLTCDGWAC